MRVEAPESIASVHILDPAFASCDLWRGTRTRELWFSPHERTENSSVYIE